MSSQLIEAYPTAQGPCSCVEEKLLFRLYANSSRSSSAPEVSKAIFFRLVAYPETAYLSFPNGELWKDVRLVELRGRKVAVNSIFTVLQLPAAAIAT